MGYVIIFAALILSVLSGCGPASQKCGVVWDPSNQTIIDLSDKTDMRLGTSTAILAEVDRCYKPLQPGPNRKLSFGGNERIDKANNRYIVFDRGGPDMQFVVVLDQNGKIIRTGPSTLNF